MSQNDALTASLAAASKAPAHVAPPVSGQTPPAGTLRPASPVPVMPAKPNARPEPTLSPNADGVIDLVAVNAKPGAPVNPFAVRAVPQEGIREVVLQVAGIIAGPTACAVINNHLVQTGETVEALVVERIDPDAVFLRHEGLRLRLPVSDKPVHVRLAL